MLRKIKFWTISIILLLTTLGVLFFNLEFIQKKIFDVKADLVGSNRSVTFYSNIDATKVATYSDKDVRFEVTPTGAISVWLGSQNKKVHSNMNYIIEDIK